VVRSTPILLLALAMRTTTAEGQSPAEGKALHGPRFPHVAEKSYVDHHIFKKLRDDGIPYAALCTDVEFTAVIAVLSALGLAPPDNDGPSDAEKLGQKKEATKAKIAKTGAWDSTLDENGEVIALCLQYLEATDERMEHVKDLEHLEKFDLDRSTAVDATLAYLAGLQKLEILNLDHTAVTDAGLVHLKGLNSLESLYLSATKVTDSGLAHLKGSKNLRMLQLNQTAITDAGLVHLAGLENLERLYLRQTGVSDAGLVHLFGLKKLRRINLYRTHVTEAGMKQLQQALPECEVWGW